MNSKFLRSRAVSLCLIFATITTYSMAALAGSEKLVGELTVSGKDINGVTVNGQIAQSGRSIFSSSTIATVENADAAVYIGKIGSIKLAPNTTLALSFSENGISGELLAGTVTVLNAENSVDIRTADGKVSKLNAGESATSGKSQTSTTTGGGGGAWFIWAAVLGGAAAGIIIAANTNNNDINLGGSVTLVSPSR